MTNREIAIDLVERWMHEDSEEDIEPRIESALDAAERRGWIEALEWVLAADRAVPDRLFDRAEEKLAELKAEEAKR